LRARVCDDPVALGYRNYTPVNLGTGHGATCLQGTIEIVIKAKLVPFA
jgi:hypothetical protein